MKNNKKICIFITITIMLISGIIGFKSLNQSNPNYTDDSKFNVTKQKEHINNIAKKPHSIFDEESKKEVRDYLISELKDLGLKPKIYAYEDIYEKRSNSNVDLENIYTEIKGKSDSYIMLATHYDSSNAKKERYAEKDGSLGAADAGYGLSTVLETIRVIKESGVQLENGIKILLTDGEEYGLLGAKEAVKESEILEGVNYVINIEARGTKGPAVMFETSPNNTPVIDLYKYSENPFSYSVAPEIYRLLPNLTDFTVFLENDLTGINISVLDGLENYHTPNDNPKNLSDNSMQHYGDQVLPIVKEFVSNEKYSNPNVFKGEDDSIFFSLGSGFIKYSKTINIGFIVILLAGIILITKKFKVQNVKKVIKYAFINLGFTIFMMAIGYGISRLLAIINGRQFKLTYLPLIKFEDAIFIVVMVLLFISYLFLVKKCTNNLEESNEFTIGSLIVLFVLSIIFTVLLPGASYLTVFPTLLITLSILLKIYFNKFEKISYILLLPIALIIILYVPTIYLFNCALTIGGLCVNVLFAMIAFISIVTGLINIKDLR